MKRLACVILAIILGGKARALAGSLYPMEGGDLSRSNHALKPSSIQGVLNLNWRTPLQVGGNPLGHPIILSDRLIQTTSGALSCLDRSNGAMLWTRGDLGNFYNPPAYDADHDLLWALNTKGQLFSLSPQTGATIWQYYETGTSGASAHGSATYVQGKVIYDVPGVGLVCVDAVSYTVLWRYPFPVAQSACTPAVEGNFLYVAGTQGALSCLNLSTGALVWAKSTGQNFTTAVTLGSTKLFVMSQKGNASAFNKTDGSLAWSFQTGSYSNSNMALCGNFLIITSDDRRVRALDQESGTMQWQTVVAGNFARCAPIVVCGVIFVTGCAHQAYGLDGQTGSVIWMYQTNIADSFVDWAESDGMLYVADNNGFMNCYVPVQAADPSQCQCNLGEGMSPTPTPAPSSVPGPCAAQPSDHLRLWLKATAGVQMDATSLVSVWTDQSGWGHDAMSWGSSRPKYLASGKDGKPTIRFSTGNYMNLLHSEAGSMIGDQNNFTLVFKTWVDSTGPATQEILSNWNNFSTSFYVGRSTNVWNFGDCSLTGAATDLTATHVMAFRSSATAVEVYQDGALVWTGPALCNLDMTRSFYLGRLGSYELGSFFKGDLQEMLVYNQALSDSEMLNAEYCVMDKPVPTPTPTRTSTRTLTATPSATPTLTSTPTFTPTASLTSTLTSTPTFTPTASLTASSTATTTATPTATFTATRTATPTLTATLTVSLTATPTPTLTATQTDSPTATHTLTRTATLTTTGTLTATPTPKVPLLVATATPTKTPTLEPTPQPTEEVCPAQIDRVMITPNPQQASADRMVSVKLGCPADEVVVRIYSEAGTLLFSWSVHDIHVQRGQWVHLKYPHDVQLSNGTYFVKVVVYGGGAVAHAGTAFVVLS